MGSGALSLIILTQITHQFHLMTGPLNLPNNMIEIENSAFLGCRLLKNLVLPDHLETISSGAFLNCQGLTGPLILPATPKTIGPGPCPAFHFQYPRPSSIGNIMYVRMKTA